MIYFMRQVIKGVNTHMSNEELIRQVLESQQEMAKNQQEMAKNQQEMAKSIQELAKSQEKIFGELDELKQGQAETNQRLDKLESRFDELESETNQRFDKLESRFDKLETETTRIRHSVAKIEIEHGQYLRGLGDGYALLFNKLEPLPAAVETLQDDVSVIKAVLTSHSKDINLLKAAN